jgi:hypothetical protein
MTKSRKARTRTVHTKPGIIAAFIVALTAVIIGWSTDLRTNLDKGGTTGRYQENRGSQVLSLSTLASLGSFEAERGGFEPPVPVSQHTAFPVQWQSALRHLVHMKNHLLYSVFRVLGPLRILSKGDLSKTCQNPVRQLGGSCAALLSNAPSCP